MPRTVQVCPRAHLALAILQILAEPFVKKTDLSFGPAFASTLSRSLFIIEHPQTKKGIAMISLRKSDKASRWHPHSGAKWTLASEAKSQCGKRRQYDEDSVIAEDAGGIFGVADGVGSDRGGLEASHFLCSVIVEELLETDTTSSFGIHAAKAAFHHAIDVAMDGMSNLALSLPDLNRMATTLAIGWVIEGRLFYAHAGDSRIYLLREGKLTRLTEDHSFVQVMRNFTSMSERELSNHPFRNVVARSIGPSSCDVRLDVSSLWLRPRDRLLFMTDGITDVVGDDLLQELAATINDRSKLCDSVTEIAEVCGAGDDLSCVVVDCDADAADKSDCVHLIGGAGGWRR